MKSKSIEQPLAVEPDAKSKLAYKRRFPVGAEVLEDGSTHFRVWAPSSSTVAVELFESVGNTISVTPLSSESSGYFSGNVPGAGVSSRYKFRLESGSYPDPASRSQPEGPHAPSEVIDPSGFQWTDAEWRGRLQRDLVIYEMHLGTFTREGTWRAAMDELPELQRIGITMLEIMPIAEFPGEFGWGYDGVNLFAPTRLYGRPDDVRAFIDRAHALGIMVILDVVYNHLGPDGNYLTQFSKNYFSSTYHCEWGDALNFDGENSGPVREYFISNARYWIEEFHFDGLRLDATQQIFDQSTPHFLAEVSRVAKQAGGARFIYVVGENETQETKLVRSYERNGYGLDALWNDDFHHAAVVAATGRIESYYSDYRGAPQEFISALKYGFLYQGQWYGWQKKRRGHSALDLLPQNFVWFLQNHDQVANSLKGLRLHQMTSPGIMKALTALLLLSPCTPMLYQGQEFSASAPFLYFADHHPELKKMVRTGRQGFLQQFRTIACEECRDFLAEPGDRSVFESCKLDFAERKKHEPIYRMHQDLLRLRKEDSTIFDPLKIDGAVLGHAAFLLRYFSRDGDDRLLLVNLGADLFVHPSPEPLLAAEEGKGWGILWSTESPHYGGCGTPPVETTNGWIIPGYAAVLMQHHDQSELPRARLSERD